MQNTRVWLLGRVAQGKDWLAAQAVGSLTDKVGVWPLGGCVVIAGPGPRQAPAGIRLLQDLRRQLFSPPATKEVVTSAA